MSSENFNIIPSNNSSSGYSFSQGQSLINFVIGSQPNRLVGTSVKLNGRFTTTNVIAGECNLNPRVALMSIIDTISISSHETGQSIETIKFYPRFLASLQSTLQSQNDLLSFMNVTQGAANSVGSSKTGVADRSISANSVLDFSFNLPTGLLLSAMGIPLDKVGGLFISLNLSNDQSVYRADAAKSPQYNISNVHLSGVLNTGSSDIPEMSYNSITSYYGVANSGYASIQYNLGLSKVLGAWLNFVPSEFINNYLYDGVATYPLMSSATGISRPNEISFLRGGSRYPLDYNLTDRFTANQTLFNSQVTKNYMSAIKKFSNIGRTDVSPLNTNLSVDMATGADNISGETVYGIGCRFDNTSDAGVDFTNMPFGVVIRSDLTTNYNNSAYLFVHHKNTLVFGKGGIQVLN